MYIWERKLPIQSTFNFRLMPSVRPANDLKRNLLNDDEITFDNSLVSLFTESWRSLLAVALSATLTFNHFQDRSLNQPQSNMFENGGKLDYTDFDESQQYNVVKQINLILVKLLLQF